jgi:hypothetical protein
MSLPRQEFETACVAGLWLMLALDRSGHDLIEGRLHAAELELARMSSKSCVRSGSQARARSGIPILTPAALHLHHAPAANCARTTPRGGRILGDPLTAEISEKAGALDQVLAHGC